MLPEIFLKFAQCFVLTGLFLWVIAVLGAAKEIAIDEFKRILKNEKGYPTQIFQLLAVLWVVTFLATILIVTPSVFLLDIFRVIHLP